VYQLLAFSVVLSIAATGLAAFLAERFRGLVVFLYCRLRLPGLNPVRAPLARDPDRRDGLGLRATTDRDSGAAGGPGPRENGLEEWWAVRGDVLDLAPEIGRGRPLNPPQGGRRYPVCPEVEKPDYRPLTNPRNRQGPSEGLAMTAAAHSTPARYAGPTGRGLPRPGDVDLLAAFLAGRRPSTLRAYGKDLDDFARFLGDVDARAAADLLVTGGPGNANALALSYRAHLVGRKLAPATIARRLAALRSIVKLARTLGRVAWSLEVTAPKVESYRDCRGPGADGWRAMLAAATAAATRPIGRRNLAMLRLLHDNGLRRAEVVGLDLADVDLEGRTVQIIGKGRSEKTPITINHPTAAALARWIADRGQGPGPLFVRLDPGAARRRPGRLTPGRLAVAIKGIGRRAGVVRGTNPHAMRHQAITEALDRTGGDVRRVRIFSRHASLDTLLKYDDARRDDAGAIARLLGGDDPAADEDRLAD
jgi:integrase/recombinase XerC